MQLTITSSAEYTPEQLALLPTFDHTKLVALARCPTFGLIRYDLHKTCAHRNENNAVAAGTLAHQGFAAMRLIHIREIGYPLHFSHHGKRLFGQRRFEEACTHLPAPGNPAESFLFVSSILYSAEYLESPDDEKRSLANIEETVLKRYEEYFKQAKAWPIWIESPDEPTKRVGIELPIDCVIDLTDDTGCPLASFRYTGRADGLHLIRGTTPCVVDEKTSYRLGQVWGRGQKLSWQMPMYMLGLSAMLDLPIEHARIQGSQLPPPRDFLAQSTQFEDVDLEVDTIMKLARFLDFVISMWHTYKHDPIRAPQFRHSCRSFNRTCQFIHVCDSDESGAREAIEEMEVDEWNPLHEEEGE